MEINYENTFADLQRFHNFFSQISPFQFKFLIILKLVVPLIWFVFRTLPAFGTANNLIEVIGFILVFIICYFILPKIFQKSFQYRLQKNYKNGKYRHIITKHKLIINDTNLHDKTKFNNIKLKLTEILKVREDQFNIYIFVSKRAAFIIPKRFFADEKDSQAFKEQCIKKIMNAKQKRSKDD